MKIIGYTAKEVRTVEVKDNSAIGHEVKEKMSFVKQQVEEFSCIKVEQEDGLSVQRYIGPDCTMAISVLRFNPGEVSAYGEPMSAPVENIVEAVITDKSDIIRIGETINTNVTHTVRSSVQSFKSSHKKITSIVYDRGSDSAELYSDAKLLAIVPSIKFVYYL